MNNAKKVGQSKLSSFEIIKTIYWYNCVKNEVTKKLLVECSSEIEKLSKAIISISQRKKKLRTLHGLRDRLLGQNKGKKSGAQDSEIFKYTMHKANKLNKKIFYTSTDDKLGLPSEKSWNRYKVANITPKKYLDKLDIIFSNNKKAYNHGPCSLFKLMSAPDLTEALDLFKIELIRLLNDKVDKTIISKRTTKTFDSPSVIIEKLTNDRSFFLNESERYTSYYETLLYLQDEPTLEEIYPTFKSTPSGRKYIRDMQAHCNAFIHLSAGEAACLYLSLGFISSRFLGSLHEFSRVANDIGTLDVIEKHYKIPTQLWYRESKEKEHLVIEEFVEVKSLGYLDHMDTQIV